MLLWIKASVNCYVMWSYNVVHYKIKVNTKLLSLVKETNCSIKKSENSSLVTYNKVLVLLTDKNLFCVSLTLTSAPFKM